MAAGFKSATVRAADVPATQTDFPSYVDLARIGITTLAEAQSVRVYADSAKTTEWAREIVSLTEMHVKVPSLTSTVVMYVDWDGVRADYAVTDTYGARNVWTQYEAVYHFENNANSSTAIGNPTSISGATFVAAAGKLAGNGIRFSGSPAKFNTGNVFPATVNGSITSWFNYSGALGGFIGNNTKGANAGNLSTAYNTSGHMRTEYYRNNPTFVTWNTTDSSTDRTDGTWQKVDGTKVSSALNIYAQGVLKTSASNSAIVAGGVLYVNQTNTPVDLDELRIASIALSANWITTEYNNQNDEATFWGTWSDAGGGGSPAQAARRGAVMMG